MRCTAGTASFGTSVCCIYLMPFKCKYTEKRKGRVVAEHSRNFGWTMCRLQSNMQYVTWIPAWADVDVAYNVKNEFIKKTSC